MMPLSYMLVLKGEEKAIGYASFSDCDLFEGWLSLCYVIHPVFRNQGLCVEGLSKLVPSAMALWDPPGISAVIGHANRASQAVAIACRMQLVSPPAGLEPGLGVYVISG